MKRYIIAAVLAAFLVACGGDHSDHDHAQPVETVTVYADPPQAPPPARSDGEFSPEQQRAGLEMVWSGLSGEDKDMLCYGMTEFGPREGYEAFSEGAGGYVVDYDVFVEFFQTKCNGYGV